MGTVSKVMHRKSSKVFALKAIDKRRVRDYNLQAQLLEEVKVQMHLEHRNLLRCITYFEEADSVYLVLELVEGGDLYQRVQKHGAVEESTAAKIFAQVCQGVKYLHDNGIIHRDLKPENILLTSDLTVKIADFGWAAKTRAGTRSTFCGTPCMLAPEMVAGKAYDKGVDVWAVGVLLYELLTGSSPFDKGDGPMATFQAIASGLDAESLGSVPAEAHSLLRGLLQRQADERTPLEECLRHPWVVRHAGALLVEAATEEAAARRSSIAPSSSLLPPGPPLAGEDDTSPPKVNIVQYELPPTDELLVKPLTKLPGGGAARSRAGTSHQSGYSSASQPAGTGGDGAVSPLSPTAWPGRGGALGLPNSSLAVPRKSCASAGSGGSSNNSAPRPVPGQRESISTVASLRSEGRPKLNEVGEFLAKVDAGTPELENKFPAVAEAALPKAPPCTPNLGEVLPAAQPPGTQLNLSHAIAPRTQLSMTIPKTNLSLSTKGTVVLQDLVDDSSGDEDTSAKERPFGSVGTPASERPFGSVGTPASLQAGFSSPDSSPSRSDSKTGAQRLRRLDDDDAVGPGAGTAAFASISGANVVPRVFRTEQSGPSAKAPAPRSPASLSQPGSSPAGSIGSASRTSASQAAGGAAAAAEQLAEKLAHLGFSYKQASEASKRNSSVEAAVGWLVDKGEAPVETAF